MGSTERIDYIAQLFDLTDMEKDILISVLEEKPNSEIAENLNISLKSVEFHKTNLFKKVGDKDNLYELL